MTCTPALLLKLAISHQIRSRRRLSGSCLHISPTVAHCRPPSGVSPRSFQRRDRDATRTQSAAATRKPIGNILRVRTVIVGTALIISHGRAESMVEEEP